MNENCFQGSIFVWSDGVSARTRNQWFRPHNLLLYRNNTKTDDDAKTVDRDNKTVTCGRRSRFRRQYRAARGDKCDVF